MKEEIKVNRVAVHFIDRRNSKLEIAKGEQKIQDLDQVVIDFIQNLIYDVWTAEDKGSTNSANFVDSNPSSLTIRQQIDLVKSNDECFFVASVKLAQHLYEKSARNASAGLLGVVKFTRCRTGEIMVALLKIQIKNEKFVKLGRTTLTQITVEDVENLLLEKIQKGAISPHPERRRYDLKVIDNQTQDDPAKYFSGGFLGCRPKQSDEHQIKKLIPVIEKYAEEAGIDLHNEKMPDLISGLRKQGSDITTPIVAQVIEDVGLFDGNPPLNEFVHFVEESDLGDIDIPKRSFDTRGTGERYITRELSYEFKDPTYRGVKITGSTEILRQIREIDGDTVTFTIRTTSDGFIVKYE